MCPLCNDGSYNPSAKHATTNKHRSHTPPRRRTCSRLNPVPRERSAGESTKAGMKDSPLRGVCYDSSAGVFASGKHSLGLELLNFVHPIVADFYRPAMKSRDDEAKVEDSSARKPRRKFKKGRRQAICIGPRRKKHKPKVEKTGGYLVSEATGSDVFVETDEAGGVPITDTESDLDVSGNLGPSSSCAACSYEPHDCYESDNVVESTSEFETRSEDTESVPKHDNPDGVNGMDCSVGPSHQRSQDLKRDVEQFSKGLVSNLSLLLPSEWSSSVVKNYIVRAIKLNEEENAGVVSSVFWNCSSGSWGLFVNGILLPHDKPLFKTIAPPEEGNIGSVADFLSRVIKKVDDLAVCSGISNFKDFWKESRTGFVDHSPIQQSPCFRSISCGLLVSDPKRICSSCQHEVTKFEREQKRKGKAEKESNKKTTTVADKYCTNEEIQLKEDFYETQSKREKLACNVERRLENVQIELDAALRDELTAILVANEHKMTELQKAFWESQRLALAANDKRGIWWHPMMIRIALHLHSKSDGASEFFQETGILQLSSTRRLYHYSHFIEPMEGCQEQILTTIKKNMDASGPDKHYSFVNLMFEEMHIKAGLVTKKRTGELIGFTNLDDTERELIGLQGELQQKVFKPRPAKKILVFMVQGITCENVKSVIAMYLMDHLCAVQLCSKTWEVICNLEEAGIRVLSITCDGAETNRKFINMHQSLDSNCKLIYCTKNLMSGDFRPLFFIVDPLHLLKTVRNCIANSYRHRKTKQLWKNGEDLSWEVFEKLFQLTRNDKSIRHKLTQSHVKLNNFSCMTALFATQSLSGSVADCIEDYADYEIMKTHQTKELVKLIRLMNTFFDCMNGKEGEGEKAEEENLDKAAYRSTDDRRFNFLENDFLQFFKDWIKDVSARDGKFTDSERNAMTLSQQTLDALVITVNGVIGAIKYMLDEVKAPRVNARVFIQDPLEQYFGILKRDNRQPFLNACLNHNLTIQASKTAALPPRKGNTTAWKRSLEADSSHVLVLKKDRKKK